MLQTAATAERQSEHPLAQAIVKKALEQGLEIVPTNSFHYVPGLGVIASSNNTELLVGNRNLLKQRGISVPDSASVLTASEVFVARGGMLYGSILVADRVRDEAAAAVASIQSMGIKTILLTGDNQAVGDQVGRLLKVDRVHAELLPDQKLQEVQTLTREGHKTAMVGDGINDAPALAEATVGIAMGSGTDVARESADVVLIGNDLSKLAETLRIARKCRVIIMQNSMERCS